MIDLACWFGSALLLIAYLLTSLGKMAGDSASYQAMNCVGAAAAGANVRWHGALSVATFEIAWSLTGLVALCKIAIRANA